MKKSIIFLLVFISAGIMYGGNICTNATDIPVVNGSACTPQLFTAFTATPSNKSSSCATNNSPDWFLQFEATNSEATIEFGSLVFGAGQLVVYHECGPEVYCEPNLQPFSSHVLTDLIVDELYQIRILFPAGLPAEGFVCVHSEDCTPQTWYADNDDDDYGDPLDFTLSCTQPAGFVANSLDCDDENENINPDAEEICNELDDDCDGLIDDDDPDITDQSQWYADSDGDGFGDPNFLTMSCYQLDGFVSNADDCDDNNPFINPVAEELCNGIDDNCDGLIDDYDPNVVDQTAWYGDYDHDGYGDIEYLIMSCVQPSGYVDNSDDCDDSNSDINPGIVEICNGIDDNCNGLVDDADPDVTDQSYWYADSDGDGFGDMNDFVLSCMQPDDYVDNLDDCDDSSESVYPGAPEIYDGLDNDCDEEVDEDHDLSVEIIEQDADLYANPSGSHPPFIFLWSTGETTQSIDKVAGEIIVVVNDDYGYSATDTILVSNALKVAENTITLFPVPSHGIIYLDRGEFTTMPSFLEVRNNIGKKIIQQRIEHKGSLIKIDLTDEHIDTGFYILKWYVGTEVVTETFLLLKE